MGLSQSTLSRHKARLRLENRVKTRRDGQRIYYTLADDRRWRIITTLNELYCTPP